MGDMLSFLNIKTNCLSGILVYTAIPISREFTVETYLAANFPRNPLESSRQSKLTAPIASTESHVLSCLIFRCYATLIQERLYILG